MKIISWNCNGALRNKFEHLLKFDADVCVVQECENPIHTNHKEYLLWASNYLWKGDSKNKGIGVFAKSEIKLELLDWSSIYKDHEVKLFLPCLINNEIQLLGVWTKQNSSPNFGYIGQLWKYIEVNKQHFNKTILIGDFNSNSIWDQWDRWWNHSDVVKSLSEINIESLYHLSSNEKQGKETQPTFFLHRNESKTYHIDYIFSSKEIANKLLNFDIGKKEDWLILSDHLPIICEIEI
jgi:exonuclease III